jgi:hypothetical protein
LPRRKEKLLLQAHKTEFPPSLTRTPSSRGINEPVATSRRPMAVRWVTTGGCIATTAIVWAVMTANATGECIATVKRVAIATWIADETESGRIETGTAGAEIGTTGVTSMKSDLGIA